MAVSIDQQVLPWQWTEDTWRSIVNQVRAGRCLVDEDKSVRWPGGARVAVALSFDADHETLPLRDGLRSPARMAQGEYGARVGVGRILDLLDRYEIPATFFMPAVCALLRPEEAPGYHSRGHEVGVHGWIHERNSLLDRDDERQLVTRAIDVLEAQIGVRPVGIRTPSWDFSVATLSIIRELGFLYDSSLMADDSPYELLENGETSGIVEIPVEWIRDDFPYLAMDPSGSSRPFMPPRELGRIWRDEFDGAYSSGGVFQLVMHPHLIGHYSRLVVLDQLIAYMRTFPDVWFTTHANLATHVGSSLSDRKKRI